MISIETQQTLTSELHLATETSIGNAVDARCPLQESLCWRVVIMDDITEKDEAGNGIADTSPLITMLEPISS